MVAACSKDPKNHRFLKRGAVPSVFSWSSSATIPETSTATDPTSPQEQNPRFLQCPQCPITFESRASLTFHLSRSHPIMEAGDEFGKNVEGELSSEVAVKMESPSGTECSSLNTHTLPDGQYRGPGRLDRPQSASKSKKVRKSMYRVTHSVVP